jgi:hypothetical protein
MGGGPLAIGIWGIRQSSDRRTGSGWSTGRRSMAIPRSRYEVTLRDRPRAGSAGPADDVASRLERLVRLHDAGDLTDPEFEAAKRATLDEAGA